MANGLCVATNEVQAGGQVSQALILSNFGKLRCARSGRTCGAAIEGGTGQWCQSIEYRCRKICASNKFRLMTAVRIRSNIPNLECIRAIAQSGSSDNRPLPSVSVMMLGRSDGHFRVLHFRNELMVTSPPYIRCAVPSKSTEPERP